MSYSSNEDLTSNTKLKSEEPSTAPQPPTGTAIPAAAPSVKELMTDQKLSPGRANLRKWLGRSFRVVITDGRILIGFFNCTDKDGNIVLSMCAEYLEEGGEERILGSVMIPGKHIVSVAVDMLGQFTR